MKDKRWFPHELGARISPALVRLQMKLGGIGLAIYWCIIEMLYENGGRLPKDYSLYAYELKWATEEQVQAVAESDYLFASDGTYFWCDEVIDDIAHMKDISEKRSTAARAKAKSRSLTADEGHGSNSQAIDQQLQSNCNANAEHNIDIQEDTRKDNNNNPAGITEREKDEVLEMFFFANYNHPYTELKRFVEHYTETAWHYSDGKAINNKILVAKKWKPEDIGPRFDPTLLGWYKTIYNCAKTRMANASEIILNGLERLGRTDENNIYVTYSKEEYAIAVSKFVADHNLVLPSTKIDWRKSN